MSFYYLIGSLGTCLENGGQLSKGTAVTADQCDGSPQQQWYRNAKDQSFINMLTGKALSNTSGNNVTAETWGNHPTQKWTYKNHTLCTPGANCLESGGALTPNPYVGAFAIVGNKTDANKRWDMHTAFCSKTQQRPYGQTLTKSNADTVCKALCPKYDGSQYNGTYTLNSNGKGGQCGCVQNNVPCTASGTTQKLDSNMKIMPYVNQQCSGPNYPYHVVGDTLLKGSQLIQCEALSDSTGKNVMAMQSNGELVNFVSDDTGYIGYVGGLKGSQNISNTSPPYTLQYLKSGDVVIVDRNNKVVNHSNTAGRSSQKLVIQSDGNFVLQNLDGSSPLGINT